MIQHPDGRTGSDVLLSHHTSGQIQAVGAQQVDVVFPSNQQPSLVLVQQQNLVPAADSTLPEHRRPVPQIWEKKQEDIRNKSSSSSIHPQHF